MRARVFIGLALLGIALVLLWWRNSGSERFEESGAGTNTPERQNSGPRGPGAGDSGRREGSTAGGERASAELRAEFQQILAGLERATLAGEREALLEAARRLRELVMQEPALLVEAEAALRDPQNGLPLRRALAVVLGTLPDGSGKEVILGALRSGALLGMERCAALSLNIVPEESEPLFERDGHPYAMEASEGLVVFVRGVIEDSGTREALRVLLNSTEGGVRLAAARVLRDSMEFADARQALRTHLAPSEDSEEVRAEAAAALAHWSRRPEAEAEERREVVGELLDAIEDAGEVVRFRLTSPMTMAPLDAEQRADLHRMAEGGREEVQLTTMEIVGRRLQNAEESERAESVELLLGKASGESSALVRETAVFQLRHATNEARAAATLVQAARNDPEPEVRAAAVASLRSFGESPAARDTIRHLRDHDDSEMVRAAARRVLGE